MTAVQRKRDSQRRYAKRSRSTRDGWCVFILKKLRERGKTLGREVTITPADLCGVFPANNRCPVFGVEFVMGERHPHGPSVDRIDPTKGYVPGNVAVISRRANQIKNDATAEELRQVADWVESKKFQSGG